MIFAASDAWVGGGSVVVVALIAGMFATQNHRTSVNYRVMRAENSTDHATNKRIAEESLKTGQDNQLVLTAMRVTQDHVATAVVSLQADFSQHLADHTAMLSQQIHASADILKAAQLLAGQTKDRDAVVASAALAAARALESHRENASPTPVTIAKLPLPVEVIKEKPHG